MIGKIRTVEALLQAPPDALEKHYGIYVPSGSMPPLKFVCPCCQAKFDTVEEMLACMNQPVEHGAFKPGDIVLVGGRWTGSIDDVHDIWIGAISPKDESAKSHFRHIDQYHPWFVITSLWQKGHNEVCSLISLMDGDLIAGWTYTVRDSHYSVAKETAVLNGFKLRPPSDKLRAEAAKLAATGWICRSLI